MERRAFIKGLIRVAPIVVVPEIALEALKGRSMVGWTRGVETHKYRVWEPLNQLAGGFLVVYEGPVIIHNDDGILHQRWTLKKVSFPFEIDTTGLHPDWFRG